VVSDGIPTIPFLRQLLKNVRSLRGLFSLVTHIGSQITKFKILLVFDGWGGFDIGIRNAFKWAVHLVLWLVWRWKVIDYVFLSGSLGSPVPPLPMEGCGAKVENKWRWSFLSLTHENLLIRINESFFRLIAIRVEPQFIADAKRNFCEEPSNPHKVFKIGRYGMFFTFGC